MNKPTTNDALYVARECAAEGAVIIVFDRNAAHVAFAGVTQEGAADFMRQLAGQMSKLKTDAPQLRYTLTLKPTLAAWEKAECDTCQLAARLRSAGEDASCGEHTNPAEPPL